MASLGRGEMGDFQHLSEWLGSQAVFSDHQLSKQDLFCIPVFACITPTIVTFRLNHTEEILLQPDGLASGSVRLHLPTPYTSVNVFAYGYVDQSQMITFPFLNISDDLDRSEQFLKGILKHLHLIREIYALKDSGQVGEVDGDVKANNLRRWIETMLSEPKFSKIVPSDYPDKWVCYLNYDVQSFERNQQSMLSLWNHNIPIVVMVVCKSRNIRQIEMVQEILFFLLLAKVRQELSFAEDLFKLLITYPVNTIDDVPTANAIESVQTCVDKNEFALFVMDDELSSWQTIHLLQDLSHRPTVQYSCLCAFVRDIWFDRLQAQLLDKRKWIKFRSIQYPNNVNEVLNLKSRSNDLYLFRYSSYRTLVRELNCFPKSLPFVMLSMNQVPIAQEIARQMVNCNEFWIDTLPVPYCLLCLNRYDAVMKVKATDMHQNALENMQTAFNRIASYTVIERAQKLYEHLKRLERPVLLVGLREKLNQTISQLTQIRQYNGYTRISVTKGRKILWVNITSSGQSWQIKDVIEFFVFQFLAANCLVLSKHCPLWQVAQDLQLNDLTSNWILFASYLESVQFEEVFIDNETIGWNCAVSSSSDLKTLELKTINWSDCWLPKVRRFYSENDSVAI